MNHAKKKPSVVGVFSQNKGKKGTLGRYYYMQASVGTTMILHG